MGIDGGRLGVSVSCLKTADLPSPVQGVHMKPHLVILASDAFKEKSQPNVLAALNKEEGFDSSERYRTTKLLDVLLTRQLGRKNLFQSGKVILNSVNPGLCRSELMKNVPPLTKWTAEEGAKNLLWGSLEDNIPPGSYISSCRVIDPSGYVLSEEGKKIQEKVWNEVGDLLVNVVPEVATVWRM
ncbi:hypothetical protein M408DRAFT_332958 [Serendipita vermifera MAFF 305830]|uniref:Uncharacterized protein n=1 Tax=Serendipita vermifera MAFF 305830 TaxID=933852 RepID=A0A0C3AQI7_SERVB|nr:hypothetical protein M408DRAFT_332958 [Serendipita vermifera MAFF 305830]